MTKTTVLGSITLRGGEKPLVLSLEFCYKDLWLGVYWDTCCYNYTQVSRERIKRYHHYDIYVGVPFFVVHLMGTFTKMAHLVEGRGWLDE